MGKIAWWILGLPLCVTLAFLGCGGGGGGGGGDDDDGGGGGGGDSTGFTIPIADITVDGAVSDWDGVDICILDTNGPGDDVSVSGSDIEYVKLAANPATGRCYVLIKVNGTVNTSLWYRLWFDNDRDNEVDDEPDDRQVDFEYYGGQWRVVTQSMGTGDHDLPDCGQVAVAGAYIEASFIPELVSIESVFKFSGRSMLGDPYTKYDWFPGDDGYHAGRLVSAPDPWEPTDHHKYKVYVANWPRTPYVASGDDIIGTTDPQEIDFFDLDIDGDVDAADEPSGWKDGVRGWINCFTPGQHPTDYGAVYVGEATATETFTLPAGTYTDIIILVDGYDDTVSLDAIEWSGPIYFGDVSGPFTGDVAVGYGDAAYVLGPPNGDHYTLGEDNLEFGSWMCRMEPFSFSGQVTVHISPNPTATLYVPTSDYETIQAAIEAAPAGAKVIVAPGEYFENLNFCGKAVTVESQEGPARTTIRPLDPALPTVTFNSGERRDAVLRGFKLLGGEHGVKIADAAPVLQKNVILCGLDCDGPAVAARTRARNRFGEAEAAPVAGAGDLTLPSMLASAPGAVEAPARHSLWWLWLVGIGLLALPILFLVRRRREKKPSVT